MKNWLNLNDNTPWVKGYEDKHSNPLYKHAESPESAAIDIRLMNTDKDLQHQINITIDDDGKLKAIVSEQTK